MKNIILKILLPFFPDRRDLEKYWWHKVAKIITLIASISSIYAVLWFVSLIFFTTPTSIEHLAYLPAYLPLSFANFFSTVPLYGVIFQELAFMPYIGFMLVPLLLVILFYFLPSLIYRAILSISRNIHRKKIKIILLLASLGIVFFISYLWRFQQIVNEASYLADDHCIKINPLIIARKNSYAKEMQLITSSSSTTEEVKKSSDDYIVTAKAYQAGEKAWLAKDKELLDGREFNSIMPLYIKQAAMYQYEMYDADYMSSVYFTFAYEETDKNKQIEFSNKVIDETNKSNAAGDKYNAAWDKAKKQFNWQYYFVSVPVTKCPAENYNIPIVPNPFTPSKPVNDGGTRG